MIARITAVDRAAAPHSDTPSLRAAKKVLMVAFHYPPFKGGSGVHRTLKFSRYLPDHGWQPIVLTANPRAYESASNDQMHEILPGVVVKRACALDAGRHFAIRGYYLKCFSLPDRWWTWCLGAVVSGLALLRKHRPQVLWSTYPIATAHLIGLTLHRLTGLPWVADFRDSMTEEVYPTDPTVRRLYRWIERQVVKFAACLVFTAPSAIRMYRQRYPELSAERCCLIPNGYDEEDFASIASERASASSPGRPIRLVHAGLIYPDERDPRAFFNAISRLKKEQIVTATNLQVELRASGSESYYFEMIRALDIRDIIHLLPALPYRDALRDCANADALLLFQAASCNHQIPAKTYEYLRLGNPILALTPEEGDTGMLLNNTGGATLIDLADEEGMYRRLPGFLESIRQNSHSRPKPSTVQLYSREHQAMELSNCLMAALRVA